MTEAASRFGRQIGRVFPDRRDPTRVVHSLVDMFRARMFAICCGYKDADLDHLRSDPAFKLACGRLPGHGPGFVFPTDPVVAGECSAPVLRGYTETRHKAQSWDRERRTVARIEATKLGLDIRFVVTSLDVGSAEWIYDSLYCARGQAENLIKLHKKQLASDRTSCRSALANQVRLVLHTAAHWLMLTVHDAIPKVRELATAEFATLRLRLLKIAARVVETTSRIRLALAAACPEADLIRCLPGALLPLGP